MNSLLKSFLVALILSAVVVPIVQASKVYAVELTAQEKTLDFLENVVKLDMTKYSATLVNHRIDYPPHWDGLAQEVLRYDLNWDDESKLYVTCRIREKTLYSCNLQVLKGSPIFTESQTTNILSATKGFLESYQTYSGASYIQEMRNILDTVDETKDVTIISGSVKFATSNQEIQNDPALEAIKRKSFVWMYTVNGVDAPQNVVSITFEEGVFKSFKDDWALFKIGSTSINVSSEEAINMAINAAENYTLQISLGNDTLTDVEFNLLEEPVKSELFMYPRETLTVYPFWHIEIYFDKFYHSAYGIQVGIWADTKQIEYCKSLSYMGGPIAEEDPTPQSTEQLLATENGTVSSMNLYIITAAVAAIITIGIATLAFKKKHK